MQVPEAARTLERDLHDLFGARLLSLIVYRPEAADARAPTPALALVESLTADDLQACAARAAAWQDSGLATPLFLTSQELARSLDAFPIELSAILSSYVVVGGGNPFEGLQVDAGHLRSACETQARSHLLHLREGYVETGGRGDAVVDLIVRSAAPLAALVRSVARLEGEDRVDDLEGAARELERTLGLEGDILPLVVSSARRPALTPDQARRLFARYLDAVERLTRYVDQWGRGSFGRGAC